MSTPWDFRPIDGARIRLELLTDTDLEDLAEMQSDAELVRYLPYGVRSREEVADALTRDAAADRLAADGDHLQPAIRGRATGRFLGTLFLRLASIADAQAEIGWVLARHAHGQGYAAEAAALGLDIAFDELGLHRVFARLDPRNTASAALCRRLGMRQEAHLVQALRSKGEWVDSAVYGILASEWRARLSG